MLYPPFCSNFIRTDEVETEIWSDASETDVHVVQGGDEEPPDAQPQQEINQPIANALSTWLTIILLFMHVRYHLTERVMTRLFGVFKRFLLVIGRFSSFCANITCTFPGTLYQAMKQHNLKKERFKRYVICKKCHQIYHLNECIEGTGVY